jgi:hypothetical protein
MARKGRTEAVTRLDIGARIVRRPGLRPLYLEVSRTGIQRRYNLHTTDKERAIQAGRQILASINEPGPARWNWKANGGRLPSGSTRLADWIEDFLAHLGALKRRPSTIYGSGVAARRFLAYVRDTQTRADRNPVLRDVSRVLSASPHEIGRRPLIPWPDRPRGTARRISDGSKERPGHAAGGSAGAGGIRGVAAQQIWP